MKQSDHISAFVRQINGFPLSLLNLSMNKRLLIVILSYGLGSSRTLVLHSSIAQRCQHGSAYHMYLLALSLSRPARQCLLGLLSPSGWLSSICRQIFHGLTVCEESGCLGLEFVRTWSGRLLVTDSS